MTEPDAIAGRGNLRVLVCGGRDFGRPLMETANQAADAERVTCDRELLRRTLDTFHAGGRIAHLIHGGARGADRLAELWACAKGIPITAYNAQWRGPDGTWNRSAGPIRNAHMLREGKPDLVIAFPGGRGTANMIEQATAAGVPVMQVTP